MNAARDCRVRCALDNAPRSCREDRIRCDSQRDRDDDGASWNDRRREARLGRTPGLNQLTGKPGKAPVGTYGVTIVATDANGKASTTTLSVVVTC